MTAHRQKPQPFLFQAAKKGDLAELKIALHWGANPLLLSETAKPCLALTLAQKQALKTTGQPFSEVVSFLLDHMLIRAARDTNPTRIQELLSQGASPLALDVITSVDGHQGYTAFEHAVQSLYAESISPTRLLNIEQCCTLLAPGSNLNRLDHKGLTPLMQAADRGHLKALSMLTKLGADLFFACSTPQPQHLAPQKRQALHFALRAYHGQASLHLLSQGTALLSPHDQIDPLIEPPIISAIYRPLIPRWQLSESEYVNLMDQLLTPYAAHSLFQNLTPLAHYLRQSTTYDQAVLDLFVSRSDLLFQTPEGLSLDDLAASTHQLPAFLDAKARFEKQQLLQSTPSALQVASRKTL